MEVTNGCYHFSLQCKESWKWEKESFRLSKPLTVSFHDWTEGILTRQCLICFIHKTLSKDSSVWLDLTSASWWLVSRFLLEHLADPVPQEKKQAFGWLPFKPAQEKGTEPLKKASTPMKGWLPPTGALQASWVDDSS